MRIMDWSSDVCSADLQSALRMALLDDRRQLGLTGDRENDIADAPRWFIDRGTADLEAVADIVPREKVEAGAEIHVAVVEGVDTAQEQVDQVLENLNPGDVAVFLCPDEAAYNAALDLLGLPVDPDRKSTRLNSSH